MLSDERLSWEVRGQECVSGSLSSCLPRNALSGRSYSGVNAFHRGRASLTMVWTGAPKRVAPVQAVMTQETTAFL